MDVILFGPPGAGKGTQASAISEKLGVPHVSTGDIFRHHLRNGTELGQLAKSYMDRGALVPDEVVVNIVASRLADDDAQGGVLLDGFPRTVNQARLLVEWLGEHGREVGRIINLVVDDTVVIGRLAGRRSCPGCGASFHTQFNPPHPDGSCTACGTAVIQRDDDREDTVRKRVATYHEQTAPVIAWARDRGLPVVDVDADRAIDSVRESVLGALN